MMSPHLYDLYKTNGSHVAKYIYKKRFSHHLSVSLVLRTRMSHSRVDLSMEEELKLLLSGLNWQHMIVLL